MKRITFILLCIYSSTIFSSTGAGGRGGGTGFIVAQDSKSTSSKKQIVLLEELLSFGSDLSKIPTDVRRFRNWVDVKLRVISPKFSNRISKQMTSNGEYDSWRYYKPTMYVERIVSEFVELDDYFSSCQGHKYYYCSFLDRGITWKRVPLSFFVGNRVYRLSHNGKYEQLIADRTKRLLELHEAVFMVGSEYYGHYFAPKTQNLIIALIKGHQLEILKTIREFMNISNVNIDVSGLWRKVSGESRSCKDYELYLFESNNSYSIAEFNHSPLLDELIKLKKMNEIDMNKLHLDFSDWYLVNNINNQSVVRFFYDHDYSQIVRRRNHKDKDCYYVREKQTQLKLLLKYLKIFSWFNDSDYWNNHLIINDYIEGKSDTIFYSKFVDKH